MGRSTHRFFSSFGWSLVGAMLLAIGFMPLGGYPIAWIALVPMLARWELREVSWAYARELYAVFLMTSCFAGFWLLFHPDTGFALRGGVGLFLAPVPFAAAFVGASAVKARWGLKAGLAILGANLLAFEYLLLHSPLHAPWLLLGHTQADATLFNQTADLGGVLMLSAWVYALNVTALFVLPSVAKLPVTWTKRLQLMTRNRVGARGLALAAFFTLLAIPTAYGAYRMERLDAVSGYLRVGLVQPNMTPKDWDDPIAKSRVAYLASMSNQVVNVWNGNRYRPDSSTVMLPVSSTRPASAAGDPAGVLIWPQGALPHLGSADRQIELVGRLDAWSDRMNVALLTGAERLDGDGRKPFNGSVFLAPNREPARRDQSLRAPMFDYGAAAPADAARESTFRLGQTRLGTVLGFESLFGEHVRDVTADADVLVVLAQTDQWGHSPGVYQHLAYTQLRAIESRRAVVVSTVRGVSALVQPDGSSERVADWEDQGVVSLDVPIHQQTTLYARRGDWMGLLGLALALVGNVALVAGTRLRPAPVRSRKGRR